MSAPAIDPRHTREHWNPGNLHADECKGCAAWLATEEEAETRQDYADADNALANLLRLALAVVLTVPGLFITALWLTNLGPAKGWHLTGPALLAVAAYLAGSTLAGIRLKENR